MTFVDLDLPERILLVLQFALAALVSGAVLFVVGFVGGPDIDGNAPALSEAMPVVIAGMAAIIGFFAGAVLLSRRNPAGRVLCLMLDGSLGIVAAAAMLGDVKESLSTPAVVFRSDLAVHGLFFVLSAVSFTGLLKTLETRRSLTN